MIYNWPNDPDWTPMASIFRPRAIGSMSISPFTSSIKSFSSNQIWLLEATWNNMRLDLVHEIQAFLNQLEGSTNRIRFFDWWKRSPSLLSEGNEPWDDSTFFDDNTGWQEGYTISLLQAALHGDRTIYVQGLPVSSQAFKKGDLIGIKHLLPSGINECFLYEVKYPVSGNSLGQAAIVIQPGLRGNAAIADPVITYCPTCPMRLMTDSDAVIQRSIKNGESFTLKFIEDIP